MELFKKEMTERIYLTNLRYTGARGCSNAPIPNLIFIIAEAENISLLRVEIKGHNS